MSVREGRPHGGGSPREGSPHGVAGGAESPADGESAGLGADEGWGVRVNLSLSYEIENCCVPPSLALGT